MNRSAVILVALALASGAAKSAAPTVLSVSPSSGTTLGGQRVTITGTQFNAPTVFAVTFDGIAASSFQVISSNSIQAVTPPHASGMVSVNVTNVDGTNGANTLYTYTSANPTVQVAVKVTISKSAEIRWGAGTSNDDLGTDHALPAETFSAYVWVVKDAAGGAELDIGEVYASDDAVNGKTIVVQNVSRTRSDLKLEAITSRAVGWSFGPAANTDTFRMRAKMGAGSFQTLSDVPVTLLAMLPWNATSNLVLQLSTPTALSTGAGLTQTASVSLIATPN